MATLKGARQIYFSFFAKIGIAVLIYTICRILFYLFNQSYFGPLALSSIIGGIRFDLMTITILYSPFILAHFFFYRGKSKVLMLLFHLSNSFSILINCIDFEYYKFTFKRTTFDIFTTSGIGDDILNLLPQFAIDFWYIALIAIGLIYLSVILYNRSEKIIVEKISFLQYIGFLIPTLLLLVIGFRGGVQLRPLGVLYASTYATAQNVPIVLNTPFTILKSSYKEDLKLLDHYPEEELEKIYTPIHHFKADSIQIKPNVVILILESFSKEYIGHYNHGKGYTPFLDSLINQSLSFSNMYANGKKSIEALPAILSGIPTLMNSAYISSKYASNQISSIANELNQLGYESSFYHGGSNGTMGFNAFSKMAGIKDYIGLDEYPNKKDYDGNWGIFDEPFLQFAVKDLSAKKQPFFSTLFTLSSHHPFTVPDKYKDRFPSGNLPILESIAYADFALKKFFESAQKQTWFDETIFILTADHTSHSENPEYSTRTGIYKVPLIFYSPKYISPSESDRVTQHADIYPSLIDFLGYEAVINSYGTSVFNQEQRGFSINYLTETFQFINKDYALQHNGEKSVALYQIDGDSLQERNLVNTYPAVVKSLEKKFLAILQQYNNRMIRNKLVND